MKKIKHLLGLLITISAIIFTCWLTTCNHKEEPSNECETTQTVLKITNSTKDSVLVYLTLSSYDSTFVQNVNGIFGIKQTGLVGSFYLHSNDTLSYTPILKLSGNIGFGSQGINCPDTNWITGVNIFEFNLNEVQESIDISTLGGVNSIIAGDLIGGPNWLVTGYNDVRHIQNDSLYQNTNRIGIYPFGCSGCTDTIGKPSCYLKAEIPNASAICNPTRAKGEYGGIVLITFKGYTNYQICK